MNWSLPLLALSSALAPYGPQAADTPRQAKVEVALYAVDKDGNRECLTRPTLACPVGQAAYVNACRLEKTGPDDAFAPLGARCRFTVKEICGDRATVAWDVEYRDRTTTAEGVRQVNGVQSQATQRVALGQECRAMVGTMLCNAREADADGCAECACQLQLAFTVTEMPATPPCAPPTVFAVACPAGMADEPARLPMPVCPAMPLVVPAAAPMLNPATPAVWQAAVKATPVAASAKQWKIDVYVTQQDDDGEEKMVATPTLVTVDNRAASFTVGGEVEAPGYLAGDRQFLPVGLTMNFVVQGMQDGPAHVRLAATTSKLLDAPSSQRDEVYQETTHRTACVVKPGKAALFTVPDPTGKGTIRIEYRVSPLNTPQR